MHRHDSSITVSSPNLRDLDSAKTAQLCALKTFYDLNESNEREEGSTSPCKTKKENKTVLRTKICKFSGHKKHIKVYQTKSDVFKFKRKSTITLQNVQFFHFFFSDILIFTKTEKLEFRILRKSFKRERHSRFDRPGQ